MGRYRSLIQVLGLFRFYGIGFNRVKWVYDFDNLFGVFKGLSHTYKTGAKQNRQRKVQLCHYYLNYVLFIRFVTKKSLLVKTKIPNIPIFRASMGLNTGHSLTETRLYPRPPSTFKYVTQF